jgi:integrase
MAEEFVKITDAKLITDKQNALLGITDHLFSSVVDRYRAEVQYRKAQSTRINEQYVLLFWQKKLGHIRINAVTPQDIAGVFAQLSLQHKQSTVHHKAVVLHSVFEFAVEQGLISTSPMDRMKLPSVGQPRIRYLNAKEIEWLLWACQQDHNKHIYPLVVMALHTGARRGELLRLKWGNITDGVITFQIRKNGKAHQVPMTSKVQEIVQQLENEATGDIPSMRPYMGNDLVFQPNRGEKLDIRKAWGRVRLQANLEDIHFHDLRPLYTTKNLSY